MKTLQMIKELTENPEKKFISKQMTPRVASVKRNVLFIAIEESGKAALDVDLDREWEEVKEPVTWQEAFEASINFKRITVEYENKIYEQESFLKIGCLSLDGTNSYGFDRKMLTEGKWYIED